MRSRSGNEKENGKVGSPLLPHTNFSLRAGQIKQLILLVDARHETYCIFYFSSMELGIFLTNTGFIRAGTILTFQSSFSLVHCLVVSKQSVELSCQSL